MHVALSSFALLPGGVLLSQGLPPQVSSALEVLTVVFGMGTRVSPPPLPPDIYVCSSHILCVELHPSSKVLTVPCKLNSESSPTGSPVFSGEALDRFVSVCSTYHYASTPDRSTSSSSRGLTPLTGWDTLS